MIIWGGVIIDIVVLFIVGLVVPFLSYLIGRALQSREYPSKRKRFESGNEEEGRARGVFLMQYYPFALLFMMVEPFVIFIFILLLILGADSTLAFVIGIFIMAPSIIYATKNAKVIENWLADQMD